MRLLFVVPPLAGHVNPLAAVAGECAARGDSVAWAGPRPVTARLLGTRAGTVYPAGESSWFSLDRRPPELRGFAALKFLWEDYLVPLADAMVAGIASAVRDFRPDALVVDQQALAGAVVAMRSGLPWATSASTSAELADPLGALPKVAGWISGLQRDLRVRHGVAGAEPAADLRFSPHLVLAFTTEALAGAPAVPIAGQLRYVGPALGDRPEAGGFDWDWLRPGTPLVLLTLGTANAEAGERFLVAGKRALEDLDRELQAVVVDPRGALAEGRRGSGVLVVRSIPQLSLLRRASAVICHAGHNTICESLGNGVPLVVAPIRDDQPVLAEQVVAAGAGLRLRFDRATPDDIRDALLRVLHDPTFTRAAARVRDSFHAAGGPAAAADALARLP
ncbi:glycosyltransferase, MGT family [Amycolatopsis marina]|uniref:Glycosyltransferase, MGT family n=1 Tax=Amycolatopsis marina TaxID=490629 RepID=A0A1I1C8B8_9PSEU|nr:glycosyltransferase [Amycolatopsis marina]SFB58881.1 glycosyltransferase, MGT family [Amycolatopsis marina]